MITIFILQCLVGILNVVLGSLSFSVSKIPLIDDYLVTGVGYLKYMIGVFPPLGVIYDGFVLYRDWETNNHQDRKSTRLNSSHSRASRMPSSA